MLALSASFPDRACTRHVAHRMFLRAVALSMLVLFHMLPHALMESSRRLALAGRCSDITLGRDALRVGRNARERQTSESKNDQAEAFCRFHVDSSARRLTDHGLRREPRTEDRPADHYIRCL